MVDDLGLDDSADTLGRWMAHYIAEKLKELELCAKEERSEKQAECCTEILKLWAHRREFDGPRRMLTRFDKIFAVIEALEQGTFRNRYFPRPSEVTGESEVTQRWLDRVGQIDDAAQALIYYCISQAANSATNENADWVKIAQDVCCPSDMDLQLIARLSKLGSAVDAANPGDLKREKLVGLIAKMEQLSRLAEEVIADIQLQVK
ncbi:MAG: hypothetical protein J0M35_01800 [Candidatus Obscuribacter phosphatis]|uniref:Uncharacterized protein n=1 Tax=Candidatus Obscuribacter phosphatis TaxID=1906157 RepID=A0A8J7PD93_9BACT|nr:hypothetical protein [Candidatus Obscuribacter phosphatis]